MPPFDFDSNGKLDAKLHVHFGKLPDFVDSKQPPTKKDPWRTINNVPFVQSIDLILPQELYEIIWQRVEKDLNGVRYAKVFMKLQDILDGDFFKEQVKKGRRRHH
jgi:ribonucleases P/MRP protein subunit RPP40